MRLLFLDTGRPPNKKPCPSRAVYELPIQPAITTVSAQDAGQRQLCVSYICRQRAFRLRHTALPNLEEELLRTALRRRATLIAHTVYECTSCDARYLGERRCSERNHFCRALGLGGACQDCEQPILLSDLLDLEV